MCRRNRKRRESSKAQPFSKGVETIMENTNIKKTSAATVAIAWLVVTIPLLYGIYYTTLKALALFQ